MFILSPIICLAEDKIDINTASLQELDKITGIGPKYAQAIIDNRPFSSIDDLLKVKGIGPKTLQKIKDQGLACVDCTTQANFETQISNFETNSNSEISNVQNLPEIIYPDNIFINEILPSPEGADEIEEYIELYNSNNFEVDLTGWKIEDTAGTKTSFLISKKILANNYLVFKRPETKILLNNDGDGLNLLTPDGSAGWRIEDSMFFTKAILGQSYNKTSSGWQWSKTLTPGSANIITAKIESPSSLRSSESGDLSNLNNSGNNNLTAGLLNSGQEKLNPWFLFFTALSITIISAVIVLFIKLKLKNNHVRT